MKNVLIGNKEKGEVWQINFEDCIRCGRNNSLDFSKESAEYFIENSYDVDKTKATNFFYYCKDCGLSSMGVILFKGEIV